MKSSLIKSCLIFGLLISFLFSCKKDNEDSVTPAPTGVINGKAQKGPFKKGADVVLNEMSSTLEPTAVSYTTTVNDDAGSFSFNNITLSTGFVSITATGYYYMENFNLDAPHKIYLEAVADAQGTSTINVNLLTHLIKPRIEKLVWDGNTFSSARSQAENELKSFLHAPSSVSTNFEDMTLSESNFLFAMSLLFQRRNTEYQTSFNYVNELNHLLAGFRIDFRDNGQIDSQEIIDTLLFNANRIQLIDTRVGFETYMASLGSTTSLSGYEPYIYAFQNGWSPQIFPNYDFSYRAIFDREVYSAVDCLNILHDTAVYFQGGGETYNMSAIVPFDSSLLIKFTRLSPDTNPQSYSLNLHNYGWVRTITSNNSFTIEAQRKNFPNGMLIWLWGSMPDSARIEYFKNNEVIPSISKIIYWN